MSGGRERIARGGWEEASGGLPLRSPALARRRRSTHARSSITAVLPFAARWVSALLLSLILGCIGAPARLQAGTGSHQEGLSSTFSMGFDSFSEKYSIEEADTLDYSNEFHSAVGLAYVRAWDVSSPAPEATPERAWKGDVGFEDDIRLGVSDVLTVSEAAVRNRWNVDFELATGQDDRLSLANELTTKRFDPSDELNLSSDYVQELARFLYRARLSGVLALSLRDRIELVDFSQQDAYEVDYRLNEASAGLSIEPGLDGSVDFAYGLSHRVVPDSSAIDYREHGFRVGGWRAFGFRTNLEFKGEVERRRYRDELTRPGYFTFIGDGHLAVRATDRLELRLRQELETWDYDAPSQVYYDRFLHGTGVEARVNITPELELGLEPRYTFLRGSDESIEDYDERSVVLAGDWIRLDRLWLNASIEYGRRDYARQVTAAGIFSDYTFVRTNLFSAVELSRRTVWNLYLSHEPERHINQDDDTTTALFSTDLTVRF